MKITTSPPLAAQGAASSPPLTRAEGMQPPPSATFREVFSSVYASTLDGARETERSLSRSLRGLSSGREASPEQLITLQAVVYRTTREAELFSKLADRAAGAVRQALQSSQG